MPLRIESLSPRWWFGPFQRLSLSFFLLKLVYEALSLANTLHLQSNGINRVLQLLDLRIELRIELRDNVIFLTAGRGKDLPRDNCPEYQRDMRRAMHHFALHESVHGAGDIDDSE
ncbi:MAG TPA: hypothetical protein VFT21_11680 [Gemmatimonadaceae bacterium]|nr:hypothetical protein [Gemmatimonadaceae bacterium]